MNFEYTDLPTQQFEEIRAHQQCIFSKKLHWQTVEDGIIVPFNISIDKQFWGEVISFDGTLVKGVNSNVNYDEHAFQIFNYPYEKEEDAVIYLGSFATCWGHYVTDCLSKLWVLNTPIYKELIAQGVKVTFVSNYKSVETCPTVLTELYRLLSLTVNIVPIKHITRFKKIYIPDNSIFIENNSRRCTIEYRHIIDAITHNIPASKSTKNDKIYLSRTKLLNKNTEFGEIEIEKLFKSVGYTIIYPELLSLKEQISIYKKAKSFVATEGSIAHNAIFCADKTEVIIIRKAFYTNDYQYMINQIKNLNVTYIDAHLSVFVNTMPNLGPFYMYVNDNLIKFFKVKFSKVVIKKFSKIKFIKYALICFKRPDFYHRNQCPEYYFETLRKELLLKEYHLKRFYHQLLNSVLEKQSNSIRRFVLRVNR